MSRWQLFSSPTIRTRSSFFEGQSTLVFELRNEKKHKISFNLCGSKKSANGFKSLKYLEPVWSIRIIITARIIIMYQGRCGFLFQDGLGLVVWDVVLERAGLSVVLGKVMARLIEPSFLSLPPSPSLSFSLSLFPSHISRSTVTEANRVT